MPAGLSPEMKTALLRLVEERYGLRVTDHQARHLDQAVGELLTESGYTGLSELWRAISTGLRPQLLESLVATLTVGETHFFRVAPQIDALRRVVIPDLRTRRGSRRRLRIWSAGCSTGEEPYTIAILLREHLPALEEWDIHLLATDLSHEALATAREARYGEWSFRDTPEQVRQRHFLRDGAHWQLSDSVRNMVRFTHFNLAAEPYPSAIPDGFDLILCRNVTIYFSASVTQRVYRRFSEALAPEGWLILGPSDALPDQPVSLEPVCLPGAVLWQKSVPARLPTPSATPPTRVVSAVRPVAPPPQVAARPSARSTLGGPAVSTPDLAHIRSLTYSGDPVGARAQAQRMTIEQPLAMEAHLLLGLLHLDEGKVEQALESLRRATFLDSQHALAHFSLGRAYLLAGDQSRANATLTHARRLLAGLPDDQPLPGDDGLVAGELRHAVETHLAILNRALTA